MNRRRHPESIATRVASIVRWRAVDGVVAGRSIRHRGLDPI
ncbi:MAG: hypothetical protein U1F51_09800 [Burkholderiales bacterium]